MHLQGRIISSRLFLADSFEQFRIFGREADDKSGLDIVPSQVGSGITAVHLHLFQTRNTMGRRKIEIKQITDRRRKKATFDKRKRGILKKAHELAVLTGSTVSLSIKNDAVSEDHVFADSEDTSESQGEDQLQSSDLLALDANPFRRSSGMDQPQDAEEQSLLAAADQLVPWVPKMTGPNLVGTEDMGLMSDLSNEINTTNMSNLGTYGNSLKTTGAGGISSIGGVDAVAGLDVNTAGSSEYEALLKEFTACLGGYDYMYSGVSPYESIFGSSVPALEWGGQVW